MAKFKTRARTLDMLGRQQIAGIPTAINELFKNAHDAYADNAEIDYFRNESLFVLRDNGIGMTKEEFENRWLTIGTDSKFENQFTSLPPIDSSKPKREITGEKGIGRLAIASIGHQVLVLTRAKRGDDLYELVVAFINWRLFELPCLNLEDISIPLKTFQGGYLPTREDINGMKQELLDSLKHLFDNGKVAQSDYELLINDIKSFDVDVCEKQKMLPSKLTLSGEGYGTHFYISSLNPILNSDIDDKENGSATKIEKLLIGFTNTMTIDHPDPQIKVAFRDYRRNDGTFVDLIDPNIFFTPEDFTVADHQITGKFDEYGQFTGMVKIFREQVYEHVINWNDNNFRNTECGPFSINFACIQAQQSDTVMGEEDWRCVRDKGDRIGGIYIYRDNIRILPYGDSDFDFIDIEKNRTKSAKYYYFSYRKMFGVIDFTKKENSLLKEKAGREGFIENKAYRQVRSILKNFFEQLAADFFREGSNSPKTEFWLKKRAERQAVHKAIEKQNKLSAKRKDLFLEGLKKFFEDLQSKMFSERSRQIINSAKTELEFISLSHGIDRAAFDLQCIESKYKSEIDKLRSDIRIAIPKGIVLNRRYKDDYELYLNKSEELLNEVIVPAYQALDGLVQTTTELLHIELSKRKRLEQIVDEMIIDANKVTKQRKKETNEAVVKVANSIKDVVNDLEIGLQNKVREIKKRFGDLNIEESDNFNLVEKRLEIENEIETEKKKIETILEAIQIQINSITWQENKDDGLILTQHEINLSLQEQLEELKQQFTSDMELSQLGLAVGIIQHEFSSTILSTRQSIKQLKAWADVDQSLETVYKNIRTNFEHLDGYLNLFTPLNRRLYRNKEIIASSEIVGFVKDLFKIRFQRHEIDLRITKGFLKYSFEGYRSSIFPVFVNVVDNAIHWLKQKQDPGERIIRLHADESGFYISNNGPAVKMNDSERIFENGFTRRSSGRGLGLFVSKEVLKSIAYDIILDEPRKESNVTFKIYPINIPEDNANISE